MGQTKQKDHIGEYILAYGTGSCFRKYYPHTNSMSK